MVKRGGGFAMNGSYFIFIKKDVIHQVGYNLVPTEKLDAVLPVEKHVAMQADKLVYSDGQLRVQKGESLLSAEEYELYEKKVEDWNAMELGLNGINDKIETVSPILD